MSPAQTAERIEMKLGTGTWVDTIDIVLDGGPDPPTGRGTRVGGWSSSIVKHRHLAIVPYYVMNRLTEVYESWQKSSRPQGKQLGGAKSRDRKWAGLVNVTKVKRGIGRISGTTEPNFTKFGRRLPDHKRNC